MFREDLPTFKLPRNHIFASTRRTRNTRRPQRKRRQKICLRKRCNTKRKQWEQTRKRCQRTDRIAVASNYFYIHWRSLGYSMNKLELNRKVCML